MILIKSFATTQATVFLWHCLHISLTNFVLIPSFSRARAVFTWRVTKPFSTPCLLLVFLCLLHLLKPPVDWRGLWTIKSNKSLPANSFPVIASIFRGNDCRLHAPAGRWRIELMESRTLKGNSYRRWMHHANPLGFITFTFFCLPLPYGFAQNDENGLKYIWSRSNLRLHNLFFVRSRMKKAFEQT